MPQQCSVPGCKSGYTETVQSFPYPKDEKKKKQWLKQIGLKKVCKSARVCQLHFLDSYIMPAEENVTKKGLPGKPVLRKNAIPTKFSMGPTKRKRTSEAKEVPKKAARFDHSYVKVNGPRHLDGFGSVGPSVPTTAPPVALPNTNPSTSVPMTPPSTPVAKPIRFEFEPPTLPEQPPVSNKDHVYDSLKERILQLERENSELRDVVDCFKTVFNQDQTDILVGNKQRVNWSDKTKTEAMETRYVCGSTGYEHIRDKFPGMQCFNISSKTEA